VLIGGFACSGGTDGGGSAGPGAAVETVDSRGEATAFDGYTLFHPLHSTNVYLVDMDGNLAHKWETEYNPGQSVYMLDNGHLLRAARELEPSGPFRGGGEGGIVQEIAWDGTVAWEYKCSGEVRRQHHDIEPMPNGNVLLIAWENKTKEEAVQAGINPERMEDDYLWPDHIVEIEPVYPDGANIVWEWHVWDHLVQELYPDKDNYDTVAEHPELVDINAARAHRARREAATPESIDQLRALGYIAGDAATDERPEIRADWLHTNSIDYNAELDQILLSVRYFSEIWIIDHGTTTEEAARHRGGRYGKGGDLLYRWGNPEAFGTGDPAERMLFEHHDARWIEEGSPGAGNILIFNNGQGRPNVEVDYSSVLEIAPPMTADGRYVMRPGEPTGPAGPVWEYVADEPASFFADRISGAHRLPNGNTLIAEGTSGRAFEVGAGDAVVWRFENPYKEDDERGPSHRPDRGPGGERRGPEGRGRRGPGGGGRQSGGFFRATRIPPDHPGLRDQI
jgi:hypothetical protein